MQRDCLETTLQYNIGSSGFTWKYSQPKWFPSNQVSGFSCKPLTSMTADHISKLATTTDSPITVECIHCQKCSLQSELEPSKTPQAMAIILHF